MAQLKPIEEVICCIADYGTFISLGDKLSESYEKVYYYSPIDDEYRDAKDCCIGDGLTRNGHNIERIDEFITPEIIKEVDLFIFPDIGWGGTQRYLRYDCKKAVWGSMGADAFELYRTEFIKLLEKIGLHVVPYKKITGLTNLILYLKDKKNKWVKVNKFRENTETWHHIDHVHSQRKYEELAVEFGGVKELIVYVVQDPVEGDNVIEIGYDGLTVDGQYPPSCFQGYEKKNELYLGSKLLYEKMPEEVRYVNEKMAPMLEEYQYRNFIATEIRKKDEEVDFIDPTLRMPGQTGEQLLETCTNLPEVIWKGANGEMIPPEFGHDFAAEATLHYTENSEIWKTICVPKAVEQFLKLYHYCIVDGVYHFPPGKNDEIGVLLGLGKTIEGSIDHLKKNLEILKDEPLKTDIRGFADLLEEIKKAEKEGVKFTDQKIPKPAEVL
jgi:hypothetical protein